MRYLIEGDNILIYSLIIVLIISIIQHYLDEKDGEKYLNEQKNKGYDRDIDKF
jgi:hypothetical protein